jgi:hypothetical protein
MGVPGLHLGLAIILHRLRDETFLAGGSASLMAVRRDTTDRRAAITVGISQRQGSFYSPF